jgi:hypothetical protein
VAGHRSPAAEGSPAEGSVLAVVVRRIPSAVLGCCEKVSARHMRTTSIGVGDAWVGSILVLGLVLVITLGRHVDRDWLRVFDG